MRKKILIVDDEIELFGFLKDTLEDYGYNVVTVETGENAVKLTEKEFFDVILMDYNLPGINGLEAFRQIKKISPLSIVIMMTAAAPESAINEAMVEGSYAVVYKPFKVEGMVEKINAAMQKPTCIVVDDRFTDREVIKDLLEQKGCKCVSIADGQSALEIVKHERPDVIFLDISMPGMDGFKVLENVKTICPDLDVIMMTAYPKAEYFEMAVKMGALTCLSKPLQMGKVFEMIDRIKHGESATVGGNTLLLVEDDLTLSRSLTAILADKGFGITAVETGARAIEESKKKFYNLAIVDFKLPDISGIEVIKKIKEVNPAMVIILMTAYESLDIAMKAIKQHVFDMLIKPVDPQVLLKSIQKGLKEKES